MPSIIDALRGNFKYQKATTTTSEREAAAAPGRHSPAASMSVAERFKLEGGRRAIVELCRKMYDDDPRARNVIQTLARDAVKGGFQVEANTPRAVDAAEKLRTNLNLDGRLDDWSRLTFRDGNSFLEPGVTKQREIIEVTRHPTLSTFRNTDSYDRFTNPAYAFWSSDKPWAITVPADATWFPLWQIVHARWDHDEGERYGRPLFSSSRKAYKRMDEGELDIAIRRKTRAGMRYVHELPGADEAAIMQYQDINKAALNDPYAAVQDWFTNVSGNIRAVQGDARLAEIGDVRHHIETFFLSSPLPMALLGYGDDIDYSVIEHQKEQYDETLAEVRSWVADQFVRPLLNLQWLLFGILPESLEYEIKWPTKQQVTPQSLEAITKAALNLQLLGAGPEVIFAMLSMFIPGLTPEMFNSSAPEDVNRLAGIVASLRPGAGKAK